MLLGLFRAGNSRIRPCPACERPIKADATFCPSCYMVFRPEGAAALREYLHGARVPADIYLLRKMHTADPNAGPVTRAASDPPAIRKAAPAEPLPEARDRTAGPQAAEPAKNPSRTAPDAAPVSKPVAPDSQEGAAAADAQSSRPQSKSRNGVESLLAFVEPLPPPARAAEDVPALYAWMLENDPVIPNNLKRLQEIHSEVFRGKPASRLGYEQHLLLQVGEDLGLHVTDDALGFHLSQLALAYRRAAEAYRKAESEASAAVHHFLWQMASLASRMRLEAWVYHARHGEAPQLPSTRQHELPLKFPGH